MKTYTMKEIDEGLWQKIKVLGNMNGFKTVQEYIMTVLEKEVKKTEKKMGRSLLISRQKRFEARQKRFLRPDLC